MFYNTKSLACGRRQENKRVFGLDLPLEFADSCPGWRPEARPPCHPRVGKWDSWSGPDTSAGGPPGASHPGDTDPGARLDAGRAKGGAGPGPRWSGRASWGWLPGCRSPQTLPLPRPQNLNQNPRTLLPKFYGLYCVQSGGKNIRVVVMNNVLPRVVKMHLKFDLKGSTYKRRASKKEKEKTIPTYKDLDFIQDMPEGLLLDADTFSALVKTLQRDCLVRPWGSPGQGVRGRGRALSPPSLQASVVPSGPQGRWRERPAREHPVGGSLGSPPPLQPGGHRACCSRDEGHPGPSRAFCGIPGPSAHHRWPPDLFENCPISPDDPPGLSRPASLSPGIRALGARRGPGLPSCRRAAWSSVRRKEMPSSDFERWPPRWPPPRAWLGPWPPWSPHHTRNGSQDRPSCGCGTGRAQNRTQLGTTRSRVWGGGGERDLLTPCGRCWRASRSWTTVCSWVCTTSTSRNVSGRPRAPRAARTRSGRWARRLSTPRPWSPSRAGPRGARPSSRTTRRWHGALARREAGGGRGIWPGGRDHLRPVSGLRWDPTGVLRVDTQTRGCVMTRAFQMNLPVDGGHWPSVGGHGPLHILEPRAGSDTTVLSRAGKVLKKVVALGTRVPGPEPLGQQAAVMEDEVLGSETAG